MHVLVTGAAGFIGFYVCKALLGAGHTVTGIDNMNAYYSVALKQSRLDLLAPHPAFAFRALDLTDEAGMDALFAQGAFTHVAHMAAQAGVRYSLENPGSYVQANLVGFAAVLELCRRFPVRHLVYASSSSVYGLNTALPFSVRHNVDHPISLYAATKKSNELMAHAYSHLYGLPSTGLRFFTVYGPWGRPDMALFLFTKAIENGDPIQVFNNGQMQRDFTYIDDIIDGVVRVLEHPATPDPAWNSAAPTPFSSPAPYRVYNIGNNNSVSLTRFIEVLETALGKKALRILQPMQAGDVAATYADIEDLTRTVGFTPKTPIEVGIPRFVAWYRAYYT